MLILKKFFVKITLSVIICIIILTSIDRFIFDKKEYIIKINGEKISYEKLESIFNDEKNRYKQILGENFFINNKQYINDLYYDIINQVTNEVLLEQYAKKLNILIDDHLIKKVITSQSIFQKDGKFSNQQYLNIIKNHNFTSEKYAEEIRKKLLVKKIIKIFSNTEFILDNEYSSLEKLITQKRNVNLMVIKNSNFINRQKINNSEIKKYFDENKNKFIKNDLFKINYAILDLSKNIEINNIQNNEIKNWYDEHKQDFYKKQLNFYRLIQCKNQKEAIYSINQLKKGISFDQIRISNAIDDTLIKKVDLGWLSPEDLPEELKKLNLKNKKQFSEIMQYYNGFVILYIEDIKPSYFIPLKEAKNDILNKIKEEKIKKFYNIIVKKIKNIDFNDKEVLNKIALISGEKIIETNWLEYNYLPKKIDFLLIKDFIKNNSINNFEVFLINNKIFFIYIKKHVSKRFKNLNESKEEIIKTIRQKKAKKEAENYANKIFNDLRLGKKYNKNLFYKKVFTRNDTEDLAKKVFSLPVPKKNKPSYGIIKDKYDNFYLVIFNQIENIILSKSQKKSLLLNIKQQYVNNILLTLIDNLRKNAKIKYGKNYNIKL